MLLNYHIGRLVLSSLCVGDLVRMVLSGARFADIKLVIHSSNITMLHGPINIRLTYFILMPTSHHPVNTLHFDNKNIKI